MRTKYQASIAALVCVCLWGFVAVVSRLGQVELDTHQFMFWVSLSSFVTLLLVSIIKGTVTEVLNYSKKQLMQVIILGFLGTYLYYFLIFHSYAHGKSMEVMIVQYTWPIMVSVLSIVIFKEGFCWRKILATAMGLLAVILVITKGRFHAVSISHPNVLITVALGALCFAICNVFMKYIKVEGSSMFMSFFAVATLSSFTVMMWQSSFKFPSGREWLIVLFTGVIVNGLSDLLWLWGLRKVDASFLAPFIFITPVVSTAYLMLFFHEPFHPAYAEGLLLIVISGLLSTKTKSRTAPALVKTADC
ncbi:MAG: DMT family transporter [Parashewanella sp.]